MPLKTPELLAPAGSLAMLDTAFAFGATAIYAGQPRYSLRVRNNDFGDLPVLADGIKRARALDKRFYVVANIYPHGAKIKTFIKDIAPVIALKPDALIMSDPGLILMVRENFPEMPIHLSVQANTVNAAAVRFWKSAGISRVILSRELSLDEAHSKNGVALLGDGVVLLETQLNQSFGVFAVDHAAQLVADLPGIGVDLAEFCLLLLDHHRISHAIIPARECRMHPGIDVMLGMAIRAAEEHLSEDIAIE